MATEKERQEFIARFCAEYNGSPYKHAGGKSGGAHTPMDCITAARALLRHARTHGRLAVEECNGPDFPAQFYGWDKATQSLARDNWEDDLAKRQERVEKRIREICAGFNLQVHLGGDPRGYTVKVKLPSGAYNTWGGSEEGYGVPQ